MTERELRDILSSVVSETNDRRVASNTEKISAIAAYVALATFAGGVVLWLGDARIDQGTRRISDRQIGIGIEIDQIKEHNKITDERLIRIVDGIDSVKELLLKSMN